MHSTSSIIRFVLILTSIVALALAFLFFGLKEIHQKNEAVYNKKAILSAVASHLKTDFETITDDQVQEVFNKQIEQKAIRLDGKAVTPEEIIAAGYKSGKPESIDMAKEKKKADADKILPVYVFDKGSGEKYYILSVRGMGLWDEIWGCIAFEEDLNTIAGVAFDHRGETPGLGAEIKDNPKFSAQFKGKKIYASDGDFTSIFVRKGGARDPIHEVDGISGATITADGVTEMMDRGLKYYEPYIASIKK